MAEALKDIEALKSGIEGQLTIAGPPLIATRLLPEAAVRLTAERPGLQVRIVSQNQELFTSLLAGKLSLVVAMLYSEVPDAGLTKQWLFDDRLVLVMRPGHPAAKLRRITPRAIHAFSWAIAGADTWHHHRLKLYFEQAGLDLPRPGIESRDPTILKSAIIVSDHIGIVARLGVEQEIEQGLLTAVDIDSPLMKRPIGVIRRASDGPSPAIDALMRHLVGVCRDRGYLPAAAARTKPHSIRL